MAAYINLSGGSYVFSGGVLEVNGGLATAGGTLNCGGGTTTATIQASNSIVDLTGSVVISPSASLSVGPNSLVIVPPGFNPATAFQSYSNLGLTHTLGTTLMVPAGTGFGGWGTITDAVVCQGIITAAPSGAINLTNGLQLSGTGQVNLGLGTLTFSDSTSGMTGGLLSLSGLTQGSGSAAFNFSGGTFQAASSFSTIVPIVLSTPGSNAVFDTSGNTLTLAGPISGVGGLQVGGPGSLTETGEGMLILSGTNSYTGGTYVEVGKLTVTANTALADGSNLAVGAGACSSSIPR